jgi:hypothetical protein
MTKGEGRYEGFLKEMGHEMNIVSRSLKLIQYFSLHEQMVTKIFGFLSRNKNK